MISVVVVGGGVGVVVDGVSGGGGGGGVSIVIRCRRDGFHFFELEIIRDEGGGILCFVFRAWELSFWGKCVRERREGGNIFLSFAEDFWGG